MPSEFGVGDKGPKTESIKRLKNGYLLLKNCSKTITSYAEKTIKNAQAGPKKYTRFERFSLKIPIKNNHFLCFFGQNFNTGVCVT